ncbi:MAG TPA: UbiA family prenyltransferase [Clostridiales bacterium]|nr:UbiA family prenyltransferase [Clostridiales bacterium]HQP70285.1 UbiA family prenyltransferase [Clostridiales bacterium]
MRYYIQIIRPLNLLITAFASAAAYFIVAEKLDYSVLTLIIISTVLTAGAGNIINDILDIDIDTVNKPLRPLPSKNMKVSAAYILYFVLAAGSITAGFFLGYHSFAAVILVNFILLLYTVFLKRKPFWGNFVVAFIGGYLFYFCSITAGNFSKILPLAISAFLFHFIREIIKDIADIKGDSHARADTMAIRIGVKKTVNLVRALMITLAFYLTYLMLSGNYSVIFPVIILAAVFPVIVFIMISLYRDAENINYERLSMIMKIDMIFGILAFYFGIL